MIRRILHISALALGLVLAGCSAIQEENYSREGLEIQFTASVGTFQVKATDTGFELGDQIGLFADSPVSAANVRMTWDGTNLVPETRLFWTPGDERRVSFSAYYPYNPEKTRDRTEFFVNADQSTKELFTASDFMTATSASKASDGVVNLNFQHCFSKVIIHIENNIPDMKIADVYLGNVKGRVEGDTWGNYSTIGQPGAIKACQAATLEGETVWAVIIPGQYTVPQLMITTTDGKQYTYQSTNNIWFGSGCRINVHVTIKEDDTVTDFTSDVTEWTDNNDLEFPDYTKKDWSFIGNIMGTSWDQDFLLDKWYGDKFYGVLYYNEGEEFKLRADGDWNLNFGSATEDVITDGITLMAGGYNIKLPEAGIYELIFYPNEPTLYIERVDASHCRWSVVGTLVGDWDTDRSMTWTLLGAGEGVKYPVLTYSTDYYSGMEFKFRLSQDWSLNYGPVSEEGMQPEVPYSVVRDGANGTINGPDGYYQIVFDWVNKTMFTQLKGNIQYASSIEDVINGPDGDFFFVKGYVTSLENLNYGNFFIADTPDATVENSLYIYGLVNQDGQYPRYSSGWYSDDFGLFPGDLVWLKGVKKTFNGVPELVDVKLVSLDYAVPLVLASNNIKIGSDGNYIWIPFRCNGWPELSSNADWIDFGVEKYSERWNDLYVKIQPNEGAKRTAVIHLSFDGAETDVTIVQAANIHTDHQGTVDDPYSIADITALVLGGDVPENDVYIKGKVSAVLYTFSASYGTGTFWLSDDGQAYGISSDKKKTTDPEHDFECYSIYWFNNQPWVSGNGQVAVGDEVVVCGKTTLYNGIAETSGKNAWIYSINGVTQ
jgi:hypothetical protein